MTKKPAKKKKPRAKKYEKKLSIKAKFIDVIDILVKPKPKE